MRKVKNLGVLLGGGGFTGARSVGFAKALEFKGIKPTYVQGVSAGALTGAVWTEQDGKTAKMEDSWKNIVEAHKKGPAYIFNFGPGVVKKVRTPALLSNSGIKALCRLIDWQKVVDSNIHFDVVVTDEKSNTQKVFSNRQKLVQDNPDILRKAVIASASIPIFSAVLIKDQNYSDGMVLLPEEAIKAGCKTIFVFCNWPVEQENLEEEIWYKRVLAMAQNVSQWLTDERISRCEKQVHIVKFQVRKPVKDLSVIHFRKPKYASGKLIKKGSISEAIDIAYEQGLSILDNL